MEKFRLDEHDEKALRFLKRIIQLGIEGGAGFSSARELGDKYLQNPVYPSKTEKIKAISKWEERKNFTSGFVSSLGGILALPVAIPASLAMNWIIQTRMVAAMAYIGGFDIDDPPVRMSIALCLLGKNGKQILNTNIEELSEQLRKNSLSQIPKQTIQLVNQAVAARLTRMAAAKGFSRFSKAIPVVGGAIGGTLDYLSCHDTAQFARELFQFDLIVDATYQPQDGKS